jgi:hypothetical protein
MENMMLSAVDIQVIYNTLKNADRSIRHTYGMRDEVALQMRKEMWDGFSLITGYPATSYPGAFA